MVSPQAAKLPRSTELLTKKENKYNNNIIHNTGICFFVISCVLINIMFHMCFPLSFVTSTNTFLFAYLFVPRVVFSFFYNMFHENSFQKLCSCLCLCVLRVFLVLLMFVSIGFMFLFPFMLAVLAWFWHRCCIILASFWCHVGIMFA